MDDWDLGSIDAPAEPLLGLVMIVKDEGPRLREVLESFKPFIDHWVIYDTGSADDTREIVFDVLRSIPGVIVGGDFKDFSTARNRALDIHARETAEGSGAIFTIMPNGDRLEGGAELRTFLEAHRTSNAKAFGVRIKPGLRYYLPLVLRTDGGWRYRGRTHEVAMGQNLGGNIPGVALIRDRSHRTNDQWRERWRRDLILLKEDLADNPMNERAWFYLGQTYECLNEYDKAIEAYLRRNALGGYFDERFEVRLRIAKLLKRLERPWEKVQAAYLEAYRFDPRRAEPLYHIAEDWHQRNEHALAYLFASRAAELPIPQTNLFLDEEIYTWKAADLAAIHGYYLDATAKARGQTYAEKALRARPDDERVRANYAFYARSAAELFSGYHAKEIGFKPEAPYLPCNPSIHFDGHAWRCILRTVNYQLINGRYIWAEGASAIDTRNYMLDLDRDLDVVRAIEMIDKAGLARSSYPVHGFEDCRLFKHKGRLCFTATVCDLDLDRVDAREIALGELDDSYAIISARPLRGPWSTSPQKNWMPVIEADDGQLFTRVVYALPTSRAAVMVLSQQPLFRPEATFKYGHRLRGGSQIIRVPGGWLCIVHDVAFPDRNTRMYLHRFVLLDEQLQIASMTDPFYFEEPGIEFCAGLAYDDSAERLVASFGVKDCRAYLGIFDYASVRSQLRTDFTI